MLGLKPLGGGGYWTFEPAIEPVRIGRPSADISAGGWLPSVGADLYDMLDETTPDAGDYIFTTTPSACEMALAPMTDPGTSAGQVIRYQAWSPNGDSLVVRMKQGAVVLASWSHPSLPMTPTIFEQTLTAEQCDAITDYTDIRIELEAA